MKKFLIALAVLIGFSPITAQAVNVTVPTAPSSGYFLTSTTTGAWIATSTPYFALGWTIGATSTGSAGINLSGGCFAINNACITSGGSGGSGNVATSSAETANRVPFWTSTNGTPATLSGGVAGFVWNPATVTLTATEASTTNIGVSGTIYLGSNTITSSAGVMTATAGTSFAWATGAHSLTWDGTNLLDPPLGAGAVGNAGSPWLGFFGVNSTTTTEYITGVTNSILSTDNAGQVVASTTIGTNLLTGALGTINNTVLNRGGTITITAASSSLLGDNNTFSGLNSFTNAGTTTFIGGLQMNEINETGASTSTFNNGIQISSGCFAIGSACIGQTAASSTILIDNNTFSGNNTFTKPLTLSASTGTTTLASGQGFTVGSTQFVVQQGSGNVGVGTSSLGTAFVLQQGGSNGVVRIGHSSLGSNFDGIEFSNNVSGIIDSNYSLLGEGTNTYVNTPSGGFIAFRNGNLDQMRLATSGSLGIGTVAPIGSLDVISTTTALATIGTDPVFTIGLPINSGVSFPQVATFAVGTYAAHTPTAPATRLDINLKAASNGTLLGDTNVMSLLSNGDVGIGTTSPSNTFAVQNNAGLDAVFSNTAAASYTQIGLQGTGHQYQLGVGNASETAFGVANKFFVYDANANSMRMVIDSSGNVGIGTTTPQNGLTVLTDAANNAPIKAGVTGTISTNNAYAALVLSTLNNAGSINDGSGPAILFQEASSTGFYEGTGDLYIKRKGADNTGILTLRAYTAGAAGNANLVLDGSTGFSGIATGTPGSLFSIGNGGSTAGINFSTATSTFSNVGGINLTNGCYAISGTCLSNSNLSGIVPIANGGTATSTQVTNGVNYFDGTRITSGTALTFNGTTFGTPLLNATQTSGTSTIAAGQGFTIGGSQFVMQQGSGNVGIGTTSPTQKLTIDGGDHVNAQFNYNNTATGFAQFNLFTSSDNKQRWGFGALAPSYNDGTIAGNKFYVYQAFNTAGTNVNRYPFVIDDSGNVGIGTTTPWARLSVNSFNNGSQPQFVVASSSASLATTTAFLIDKFGNVGIGTSSPGSLLSINSIANFTTATSTFYGNGINLTSGCFAILGTCIGGGGGSGTVNSGTTGQFPFYASNGTALTATSSIFVSLAQNIGVGSTTPGFLLSVGNTAGFASLTSASSTIWSSLVIATSSPNAFVIQDRFGTQDFVVSTASSTNNNPIFQILGTSTPGTLFQVDQYGHLTASSTPKAPTVSSCGTGSPTLTVNSNDVTGDVTTGTAATACTITFGAPYTVTPEVFVSGASTVSFPAVTAKSTTSFTIGISGAVTGDDISYYVIMP